MRYSRQEVFDRIGGSGQKKISKSSVCIVGAGALGTHAAELLVRAGIGTVSLIDHDHVELSNLQRVSLLCESDVGVSKAVSARDALTRINPDVEVIAVDAFLNEDNVDLISGDVVLDCTDNLETAFLLNEYCVARSIPLVHASAVRDVGNVFVVSGGPCLKCLYPQAKTFEKCRTFGVLNTIIGVISSIQVNECLKIILGALSCPDLIRYNIWTNEFSLIRLKKKPDCPVCGRG